MAYIATEPGINNVAFTVGVEGSDVINVAVALLNGVSSAYGVHVVKYWLSSDAAGTTLASDPGTLAIGTNGTILTEHVDDVIGEVLTDADGQFDLDIGHVSTSGFYLNVALPNGRLFTSPIAQFA